MNDFVVLRDVSIAYNKLQAVKDVNLTIKRGQVVAILGLSGSGKTSLLKAVAGLIHFKGNITIDSIQPKDYIKKRLSSFVFQSPQLLPWLSVYQNIQVPLEISNHHVDTQLVDRAIKLLGLEKHLSFYPNELSGGLKQKVALAMALVTKPQLLLLDEPFASIDEMTRTKLNIELANIIRKTESTALLVTHSVNEAVMLSDRVFILTGGSGIKGSITINLPTLRNNQLLESGLFQTYTAKIYKMLRN